MRFVALIPARLASTRLPNKLLRHIGNNTVITTTYQNAVDAQVFDDVYVVTDSKAIAEELNAHGAKYILDENHYECGTDRIAAVVDLIADADIIINIQGDEPFLNHDGLNAIKSAFIEDKEHVIDAASLMHPLTNEEAILNPNNVKVVTNVEGMAVLFSRSPIPYVRDHSIDFQYYKHIGIYAFRKAVLKHFASLKPQPLELIEKLEGNRFVEYQMNLKMLVTDKPSIGIDTIEDLEMAQVLIGQQKHDK